MIIKISDKLRNYKGVTLITLIIAITIFAIFITVFSYVMVAKHGASALYVQSTQACAVAQAGIEYGIRCAQDSSCWDYTTTATLEKDFGGGSFTLVYNDSNNTLESTGTVGVAERVIILQNFRVWVASQAITLVPGGDLPSSGIGPTSKTIDVPLMNNYNYDVYIYKIELAKEGQQQARLNEFTIVDTLGDTLVWTGNKVDVSTNPDSPTLFPFNQVAYYTMTPGAALDRIEVQAKAEVSGTWHLTFWHSKQSDLSDPQSSLVTFNIP